MENMCRCMCVIMAMSMLQFRRLCLRPILPPTLYVHRQLRDAKEGLRATWFPATTHRYPSVTGAWMSAPVPQSLTPALPHPSSTSTHPPTQLPPDPQSLHLPASLPDSVCKSAPWMMDYCVTAACEGLICFIDFSLGRMPVSAASHLFPKTRSCNRR